MPGFEHFDAETERYDAWFDKHSDIYNAEIALIESLLPTSLGNALEIGAGTGRFAAPLNIKTGVEPAENMAAIALKRGLKTIRATAEKLPFKNNSFDTVIFVTTLCFIEKPILALDEARRVLKPGGHLLTALIDPDSPTGREYAAKAKHPDSFYREAEFIPPKKLENLLYKAGFAETAFKQALIPGKPPASIENGYGSGTFVAAISLKPKKTSQRQQKNNLPREKLALPNWRESLETIKNGNISRWIDALEQLPHILSDKNILDTTAPTAISNPPITAETARKLENSMMKLHPWRKGPFNLFGLLIDAEWRSNMKWKRLEPHLGHMDGETILDIGCGNGYYALRALGAGAETVLGVDTSPLHVIQFQALNKYLRADSAEIILLDCDNLPRKPLFDTVFSMGVIYHRPNQQKHMRLLLDLTKPGGRCVIETLVVDGDEKTCLHPNDRYAQMRNVHAIPSPALLKQWAENAGFAETETLDISTTTIEEQRSTKWMTFHSLQNFLHPENPNKTIENHPAPKRAILLAQKN